MRVFILSIIFAFSTSSYADYFLAAKCSVSKCTFYKNGEISDSSTIDFCSMMNVIDIYHYSGHDETRKTEGLFGINNAAVTSLIGNISLSKATVESNEKTYTINPDYEGIDSFVINKGFATQNELIIGLTKDKKINLNLKLDCNTVSGF